MATVLIPRLKSVGWDSPEMFFDATSACEEIGRCLYDVHEGTSPSAGEAEYFNGPLHKKWASNSKY